MGVTCHLIPIEHDLLIERAPAAIAAKTLDPLRELVRELGARPREIDEGLVAVRRARLKKLGELNLPDVILESERRQLALALGEGRQVDPAMLDRDALISHLVKWGCHHPTDIDKSADLIHWWCDPARRARRGPSWSPEVAGARETVFDRMVHGAQDPPDLLGIEGGYNPPTVVAEVASALQGVDSKAWSTDVLEGVNEEDRPYPSSTASTEEDLDYARAHFAALRSAYDRARRLGRGLAISYG